VENNTMTDNDAAGLALEFCDQTTVSGNMMDGSSVGLLQVMTNWSLIHDNKIEGSLDQGIEMMLCYNNTVFLNIIANTIGGQMFTGYGAFMMSSANNTFYHNDFMHNYASPQVIDDSDMDHWNPSYPTGGNHWTDYSGSDTQSGPNQNIPGSDGIGDTPYEIDDSISPSPIFDHYPLMATLTHENGPTAFFTVTPASGPASTNFTFNASLSWDPDIYTGALEVRWDFNGDSAWDTGWSTQMIVQHTYTQAGEYNVTMEVRNGTGSTNTMTWHVEVDQVVIPEFTTLLVPICAMTALFLVLRGLGRRR
jgi:parallel beta-helix repeat protein